MNAGMQLETPAGRRTGRLVETQAGRHAETHLGSNAGRKAYRQAERRQAERGQLRHGQVKRRQAGKNAYDRLVKHLAIVGYVLCDLTPGLLTHITRPLSFALVLDELFVK